MAERDEKNRRKNANFLRKTDFVRKIEEILFLEEKNLHMYSVTIYEENFIYEK